MDETLVDLFYFITVGVPPRNMSKNSKLATATNKTLKMLFNVDDSKPTLFSGDDFEKLLEHIKVLSELYQDVVIKYFSQSKLVIDLSDEAREMRKQLYEKGSVKGIRLLYPPNPSSGDLSIFSLNGSGQGGVVNIKENKEAQIVLGGNSFKISDIVIGFFNNETYIFKITELEQVELDADNIPINWNMPLHTQLYRFFFPNEFDVAQVRATKNMIESEGLEYTVKYYVSKTLGFVA